MKDVKTIFTVLVFYAVAVKPESEIRCSAPSVNRGQPGTITCFFKEDIKKTEKEIIVQHYHNSTSPQVSEVLNCFWSDTPEPECTEEPGYLYAGLNETTLTIKIPSAREEHEGKYLCQVIPTDPTEAAPCNFTLKDPGLDSTTQSGEGQGQKEEKGDHTVLISVVVGLVVLVGIALVVVFIFRKKLTGWCRRRRDKKTSRANADNAEAIPLYAENTPDSPSSSPHFVAESQLLAKSMVSERNNAAQMNVTDGMSLDDTSINALMNTDRSTTAGFVIENWTTFTLENPVVTPKGGEVTMHPCNVAPATREAMVTSGGRMSWSRGVVSWEVGSTGRLVYITWGVPASSKNWLAVGMSRNGRMGHSQSAFDCMYNKEISKDIYFVRKSFQTNQFPVIFRDDTIEIEGVMEDDRHTVIEIIIRPVNPVNLAGPIRSSLLQQLPESLTSGGEMPITDGDSIAKKSTMDLMNAECEVTVGFLIENWTKFNLLEPAVKPQGGVVTLPPCNVAPATREAMVAKKKDGSSFGSWGTLSYTLENCDHLVFIMWCVPASQKIFKNYLAVGVSRKGYLTHGESKEAFDRMYTRESTKKLYCNLKEFQTNAFPVIFRDDNIEIEGTMGNESRTEIKIIIRPLNREDLAKPAEAPRPQQD